jgi:hypothetical protein
MGGNAGYNAAMATNLKGWEEDRKRWTRMHEGVRYRRTCRQLGLPPEDWTAERSYAAFLKWFRIMADLDEDEWKKAPPPTPESIKEIEAQLAEEGWKAAAKEFEATGKVPDGAVSAFLRRAMD